MENKQLAILGGFILIAIIAGLLFFGSGKSENKDTGNIQLNLDNFENSKVSPTAEIKSLIIEDLKEGTGPAVKDGDTISVNYQGALASGTVFDSTQGKDPFIVQIGVGKVIKGWDQGILGMKEGGVRRLTIPPSLGYGSQAAGNIPPNSILIFEVELVKIIQDVTPTASPSPGI